MDDLEFPVSDVERFAEHLGFKGIDSDMLYETMYQQQIEYDDYESHWEGALESIETY